MEGLPALFDQGQGGLFDIALLPGARAGDNMTVYLTLSTGNASANRTILVRGTFDGRRVSGLQTIFKVQPDKGGGEHFGGRLIWLADGTLLMSVGDGGNPPRRIGGILARDQAQNLGSHLGSILRLGPDGKAPRDNPFYGRADAKPEIWSFGHRNVQGLVRDPATGQIWASEHGPRGGDEVNLVTAGDNFGWPRATYGRDYQTGQPVGQPSLDGMVDPKVTYVPRSVAPSGLAVYRGDAFPAWKGDLFAGTQVGEALHRIVLDERANVTAMERLPIGERVRDVRSGPDGFLYVLTDESDGKIIRIEPKP